MAAFGATRTAALDREPAFMEVSYRPEAASGASPLTGD